MIIKINFHTVLTKFILFWFNNSRPVTLVCETDICPVETKSIAKKVPPWKWTQHYETTHLIEGLPVSFVLTVPFDFNSKRYRDTNCFYEQQLWNKRKITRSNWNSFRWETWSTFPFQGQSGPVLKTHFWENKNLFKFEKRVWTLNSRSRIFNTSSCSRKSLFDRCKSVEGYP